MFRKCRLWNCRYIWWGGYNISFISLDSETPLQLLRDTSNLEVPLSELVASEQNILCEDNDIGDVNDYCSESELDSGDVFEKLAEWARGYNISLSVVSALFDIYYV